MSIYKYFLDGIPEYLARHYWWAYLWQPAIRFFDQQPIINAILFGNYTRLLKATLARIDTQPGLRTLQLTCVYGKFTPKLVEATKEPLHLCDVATAQLEIARRKTAKLPHPCHLVRMNAEALGYRDNSFDQIVVFFLFHELPPEARRNVLAEIARTIRPGGTIVVTEYGETPGRHWLNFPPFRRLLEHLEPFLAGFREEHLESLLEDYLQGAGKRLDSEAETQLFGGFYRVCRFRIAR